MTRLTREVQHIIYYHSRSYLQIVLKSNLKNKANVPNIIM